MKALHRMASARGLLSIVLAFFVVADGRAQDEHPAEKYGFGFVNPAGGLTYSWDVFRNAFYGVPIDSATSWFTATFDKILYEEAVRSKIPNADGDSVNGSGRCFGWSTAAAMMGKFGGYRGFCGPPVDYVGADPTTGYPPFPGLPRVLEITQIQQITLTCLQGIIDQSIGGHSNMANYIYNRARQAIERDDITIVGVTKTLDPLTGAAHAVVGYNIEDSTASLKKLMVVDPNRTWGIDDSTNRGWYERGENFILLDLGSNEWNFRMAGWSFDWPTDSAGDASSGNLGTGHIIIYPLSYAGVPGRTPTSLGLGVTALLSKFFLYMDGDKRGGKLLQVTDPDGRQLFTDDSDRVVDHDSTSGLRTMAAWFPMMSVPDDHTLPFELWFARGSMPEADVLVHTGDGSVNAVFGNNAGYLKVSCSDPDRTMGVSYGGLMTPSPSVTLSAREQPTVVNVEIIVPIQRGGLGASVAGGVRGRSVMR